MQSSSSTRHKSKISKQIPWSSSTVTRSRKYIRTLTTCTCLPYSGHVPMGTLLPSSLKSSYGNCLNKLDRDHYQSMIMSISPGTLSVDKLLFALVKHPNDPGLECSYILMKGTTISGEHLPDIPQVPHLRQRFKKREHDIGSGI
jgi:hypothetical protein